MGIVSETATFLVERKRSGVDFGRTLTLGRHTLYAAPDLVRDLCREAGAPPSDVQGPWADGFFRCVLGARELESVDNSNYEGATLVHDMNRPVPEEWEDRFDVVFDGGALEHIFNFPTAIANCMRMVRTGGSLLLAVPANNQLGHGFYQFSPELFFRTLTEDYGFRVERMVALEYRYMGAEFGTRGPGYEVADPAVVGARVSLANSHPVGLLVHGRKIAHHRNLFDTFPQQSDYARLWQTAATSSGSRPPNLTRRVASLIPAVLRAAVKNRYETLLVHSLRNRRFFVPLKGRKS